MPVRLPFVTLLLLITFASVNAILFTPALPDIASYFSVSADEAQKTITWFLVGYAVGQLVYGPLANRFGRKPALYTGTIIQIISSLLCVASGSLHAYWLLVVARTCLALGSGVGLKMTFTLVNECFEPRVAIQKISWLLLAFAVVPGLGAALGGILNASFGWTSCFWASAAYGLLLLWLIRGLPETLAAPDPNALRPGHLLEAYGSQFRNTQLVSGGLIMGGATCIVYVYAALAPFIVINHYGVSSAIYGIASVIPSLGLLAGSLLGARLSVYHPPEWIVQRGIFVILAGAVVLLVTMLVFSSALLSVFLPMAMLYFGSCLTLSSSSAYAMSHAADKAQGSAVMNFVNMGFTTLVVMSLGWLPEHILLLPLVYLILGLALLGLYRCYLRRQ